MKSKSAFTKTKPGTFLLKSSTSRLLGFGPPYGTAGASTSANLIKVASWRRPFL
jgi:hypothetical protein